MCPYDARCPPIKELTFSAQGNMGNRCLLTAGTALLEYTGGTQVWYLLSSNRLMAGGEAAVQEQSRNVKLQALDSNTNFSSSLSSLSPTQLHSETLQAINTWYLFHNQVKSYFSVQVVSIHLFTHSIILYGKLCSEPRTLLAAKGRSGQGVGAYSDSTKVL